MVVINYRIKAYNTILIICLAMSPSIAVIINSCAKFYQTTIPIIIESCKSANIPSNQIYVVVGECDYDSELHFTGDFHIVFCRYVNIDYNTAIYFTQTERGKAELQKYTHFFYTHDTTTFMNSFWKNISNFMYCDSYIKLRYVQTQNIGFFNVSWFLENKTELFSYYTNYDKQLQMAYKAGDFPNKDLIYSKFSNLAQWLNEDCLFLFSENYEPLGYNFFNEEKSFMTKIYSEEERKATVYENPGIIKYQKNWNPTKDWNINL